MKPESLCKLEEISLALGTPALTVERLLDSTPEDALRELVRLIHADEDCRSVLNGWGADRKTLEQMYWFLMRAGAEQWVGEHFVPVIALANPWSLEFLLACRDIGNLDSQAALAVLEFARRGWRDRSVLDDTHAVEVALMSGPRIPARSLHRPFSITDMHRYSDEPYAGQHEASPRIPNSDKGTNVGKTEFEEVARKVYADELVVGVEPARARALLMNNSLDDLERELGERPSIERAAVSCAFWLSWLCILCSIPVAAMAFRWWSILAVPLALVLWWMYYGAVSRGPQVAWRVVLMFSAALLLRTLGVGISTGFHLWIVCVAASLMFARLTFAWACRLVRALTLRNERAFRLLEESVVFVKDAKGH